MKIVAQQLLQNIAADSSTFAQPACDSSDESKKDASNDMQQELFGFNSWAR